MTEQGEVLEQYKASTLIASSVLKVPQGTAQAIKASQMSFSHGSQQIAWQPYRSRERGRRPVRMIHMICLFFQ